MMQIPNVRNIHDFEGKLKVLSEWCKGNEEKSNYLGLYKLPNNDYLVDIGKLSAHFSVKERSLTSYFTRAGYRQTKFQKSEKCALFTKQKKDTIISLHNAIQPEVPLKEEEIPMLLHWERFSNLNPEKTVQDFILFCGSKKSGWIKTQHLISFLINSDVLDVHSYCFIYTHFGPIQSIPFKISMMFSSVLTRGWRFNGGYKTVNLEENGLFEFRDENFQIRFQNDCERKHGDRWLFNEEGKHFDINDIFERFFPQYEQSNYLLRESIEDLFPSIFTT